MKLTTNRAALVLATFATLALITACQPKTEIKNANVNDPVTNTTPQPTASQPEVAKAEMNVPAAAGSLATPTDAYNTGYAARQHKDIAGLKRVLAKDALEFLTMIGEDEKKTLDDQLKTLAEKPQAPTAETRNEKISGNRASLEYLNERGKWVSMEFVKEGDDWKIDLPKGP